MKTTLTVLTSILLAFALGGTAVGSLPEIELPEETVPTGGVAGQAIGCHLSTEGFAFVYGKNGVPASSGAGDGECEFDGLEHSGDVTHTVLKVTGSGLGYTSAEGYDFATGEYVQHYVLCPEPATLLVDWETGDVTYLEGADCTAAILGTLDISDVEWYTFGAGYDDVKFVHTDNLVDALAHLLT